MKTLKILIAAFMLFCLAPVLPSPTHAQGDIAKEIEKVEAAIKELLGIAKTCDDYVKNIVVPPEDAPDAVWDEYVAKVKLAELCIVNLEGKLGSLRKRLTELAKRLPNLEESPESARYRKRLDDLKKQLAERERFKNELRARLAKLRKPRKR